MLRLDVWILGFGFWDLGFGIWNLGFGIWVLGFGFWVLEFGFWNFILLTQIYNPLLSVHLLIHATPEVLYNLNTDQLAWL